MIGALTTVINVNKIQRDIQIHYDFTKLPEANGATITTVDDMQNLVDGAGVNSPTCEVLSFNGDSIKSFKDETNRAFNLGNLVPLNVLNKSFEIWFAISTTDGMMASAIQICGSRTSDTNVNCGVFISSTGILNIIWGYTGSRIVVVSSAAVLIDGSNPVQFFRCRVNFESDSIQFYLNEESIAANTSEGTIVGLNPASYNNTANWHVGTINSNGTLSSNTTASNFFQFMVTNKLAGATGGSLQDTLVWSKFVQSVIQNYTQWQNELGVTLANISSKRDDMIAYIFNGNGIPTDDTPDAVNSSYTGLMHGVDTSSLVGAGTVRQIRWDILDGDSFTWTYYQYIIPKSSGSTNKWMICHRGHGSEGAATHLAAINRALSEGYDVMWVAMPIASPDTDGQNTTNNPAATLGHEALYQDGIDTVSYNALELFFHSQVCGINYLQANFTVTTLFAIGISGGAYTVSILAAIDTRITKTVAVRGFRPRSSKYYPFIEAGHEPDFEQGGANDLQAKCGPRVYQFFTDHPQLEIMAMCTDGGRMYGTITHTNDTARFGGYTWKAWKDALKTKCNELGGRYFQFIDTTTGNGNHAYQTVTLDRAFYEFAL